MPLTLATRIGPDTVGKLELAARRRYAEAQLLANAEPLGAIYLLGYTVEIRLKSAYFRVVVLTKGSLISSYRLTAEAQIRLLLGRSGPMGHNLFGWARLLEDTRSTIPGVTGLPTQFASEMYLHVQNMESCWTEVLRYRANKPYDEELSAIRASAKWFKLNARALWS